jgi:hypothetical protein
MQIDRFTTKTCCGGKSIIFKIDCSVSKSMIEAFVKLGFKELEHFTKVGIMYVENPDFILTGPIGSNKLQVKCRKKDCDQNLNVLEKTMSIMNFV